MENDEEFQDFLREFSDAYVGDEIKELRFLLSDSLEISDLAIEHPSGMSFCNVLDDQGIISNTDVNLLVEIAEVTNRKKAKSRVDRYIKSVRNYSTEGNGLSEFRRTLYRCLKAITETASGKVQSDLHKLIDTYGLRSYTFNNKWDLIFYLEQEKKITKNIKHLERFINGLNTGTAKEILQEYCSSEGKTGAGPATAVYSTGNLNDLICELYPWWDDQEKVNMLKVLLRQFKIAVRNIERNNDPYELLKLLIAPGVIANSDVNVLIEAVYLCDLLGLESKIKENVVPLFQGFESFVIHKISNHRRNLIEFGMILTDKSISTIAKWEEIRNPSDQWDLIFKLEKKNVLTEEGKVTFVEKLEKMGLKEEAKALNTYPGP